MLTGVANCARTPPMLLPVEPLPWALSRSSTITFLHPALVRCQAMLEPTIPPPMITTSAVEDKLAVEELVLISSGRPIYEAAVAVAKALFPLLHFRRRWERYRRCPRL